MKGEIKRIKNLLGIHYFIHERLYNCKYSHNGYIKKKEAKIMLRMFHNIPKEECPIIIESLKILGLINEDGDFYILKSPKKSHEELVFDWKKKMKII